jgi:hypothetical protein
MARLPALLATPLRVSADLASASSWLLSRYADALRAIAGEEEGPAATPRAGDAADAGEQVEVRPGRAPAAVTPEPRVAPAPAPAPAPPARKPPRPPASKAEPHAGAGTPARKGGRISNPKAARKVRARTEGQSP